MREGQNFSAVVKGISSTYDEWGNIVYRTDNGTWKTSVQVLDLTPRFKLTEVDPGSPGSRKIYFGVKFGEIICSPQWDFVTQAFIVPSPTPFFLGVRIDNPLAAGSFTELLNRLLNILLVISASLVVLMIVWAAFLFVTSEGVPQKIQQAKDAVKWAVIGFLIVVSAKAIFNIINIILPFD